MIIRGVNETSQYSEKVPCEKFRLQLYYWPWPPPTGFRLQCIEGVHELNPAVCQCECRDRAARQRCLDQGAVWARDQCACILDTADTCGLGLDTEMRELVVIAVLSILITIMLIIVLVLIRRISVLRRRIQLQESLRRIQNIDSFYEFMTKERPAQYTASTSTTVTREDLRIGKLLLGLLLV